MHRARPVHVFWPRKLLARGCEMDYYLHKEGLKSQPLDFLFMKVRIVQNRYLNALFILMLFSAMVHMVILGYLALRSGDLCALNYFNILEADVFIPGFLNSAAGNIFSLIFAGGLYLFILAKNK